MLLKVATMAALLLAPLYAQAPAKTETAAALPDAREIINRHIKAIGGREAILAHKSMHATGTLAVPASGISGPMEIFGATNPDRVLVKTTVTGIGDITEGFDGSHAWSMSPMTGPMLKVGKELTQTKLDADFYSELRDPTKYPAVKTIEKTTFDGRPCYKVSVKRIFMSNDSGPISNPDGLRNQIEGGALQGTSRALGEEVTWDDQKVTSIDWRTYHSLPLGFDIPKIEIELINRPDEEATGAGETSITVVAAAIGNAIFDATGARIRQIPLTPERVKAALAERG